MEIRNNVQSRAKARQGSVQRRCSVCCFVFEVLVELDRAKPGHHPKQSFRMPPWLECAGTHDDTDPFISRTPTVPQTRTAKRCSTRRNKIIEDTALYREMMNPVRRDYPIWPSPIWDARGPQLRTVTHGLPRPRWTEAAAPDGTPASIKGRASAQLRPHPRPAILCSPICIVCIPIAVDLHHCHHAGSGPELRRTSQPPTHGGRKRTGQP